MEPQKTKIEIFLLNLRKIFNKKWSALIALAGVLFPILNYVQEIGFLEQWPNLGSSLIGIIIALGAAFGLNTPNTPPFNNNSEE